MAVDINTPVLAIEGIGPATATALNQAGIWTVCDLVRVRLQQIYEAVRAIASEQEARSWKRMALLLQIAEVTPQWAEVLVQNGIETIEALHRQRVDAIDAMMTQARAQGTIPDVPTASQIGEMIRDAAVVYHTGTLGGRLIGSAGRPVAAATIRIGPAQTRSDERGRFRLWRIPLGRPVTLEIVHADYDPLIIERPTIGLDAGVIGESVYRMTPPSADRPVPETLSELDGDALPTAYRRTRQVMLAPEALCDGDILVVREFYSEAPDVQLVSRMKSWSNGELLVYTVRLPLLRLPAGVRLKDQFRVVGGELTRVEMGPVELHRYKLRLRLRKAFAGRPRPTTEAEARAFVRDAVAILATDR